MLEPLHPADIADLLEQVDSEDRTAILNFAGDYIDGEILSEIDEDIRDEVIETLEPAVLAEAVRELESDDVVDLIEGPRRAAAGSDSGRARRGRPDRGRAGAELP